MNRFILVMLLCFGMVSLTNAQAQNDEVTEEEYQHLIKNKLQMEFRNSAIEALKLSEDQIVELDPLLQEYLDDRTELITKKYKLLKEYKDKTAGDATVSDDKTAEFIEDYWELDIDVMKRKKAFFDMMEDVIPTKKAASFFLLEEMAQNQLKQSMMTRVIPIIIDVEKMPESFGYQENQSGYGRDNQMTEKGIPQNEMKNQNDEWTEKGMSNDQSGQMTANEVDNFNNWVSSIEGQVQLNHQYTNQGITQLVKATSALAEAGNVQVDNFDAKKDQIMNAASELLNDPMSNQHADKTKEAFTMIAELMQNLQSANDEFSGLQASVEELSSTAANIQEDQPLTDQSETVYSYFKQAGNTLNQMVENIKWDESGNSKYDQR